MQPSSDLAESVLALQELQVRRRFFISQRTRLSNATGALVRRMLGWRADLPEAKRTARSLPSLRLTRQPFRSQ